MAQQAVIRAGIDQIRVFNTIALEMSSKCNRVCSFCPNHGTDRDDEFMDWTLLEKAAEELARMRYRGVIQPFLYNEPMRDKRLPDFYRLFKEACPGANRMMNTNGDYIKRPEDLEKLFEAGMTSVVINIYAAKDHTPEGIALADRRFAKITEMVEALGRGGEQGGIAYWKKGVIQINRKYGDHFDGGFKKTNRSGNIKWFAQALKEPLQNMCVRPWRVMNFNWKGDSVLCCNDYHGVESFGNLRDRTILEIWNDAELNRIRASLQDKDRSVTSLCAKCDWHGGPYQHVIQRVELPARRALCRA